MAELKCRKHPRYQAKREPRANCEACWKIWNLAKELAAPKPRASVPDYSDDDGMYFDSDTRNRINASLGYGSDESGWHNGWQ